MEDTRQDISEMNLHVDYWRELGFNNTSANDQKNLESTISEIINNLHNVLNARRRWTIDTQYESLSQVLSYGLPDFFNFNPGTGGHCQKLCQVLQVTICQQEPRLQKVQVELSQSNTGNAFQLYFKIYGFLKTAESIDEVLFESVFNLNQMKFKIRQEKL